MCHRKGVLLIEGFPYPLTWPDSRTSLGSRPVRCFWRPCSSGKSHGDSSLGRGMLINILTIFGAKHRIKDLNFVKHRVNCQVLNTICHPSYIMTLTLVAGPGEAPASVHPKLHPGAVLGTGALTRRLVICHSSSQERRLPCSLAAGPSTFCRKYMSTRNYF